MDRYTSFYGLPTNGPSVLDGDKPKKKKEEEEPVVSVSSEEEIFNETTNNNTAISLSIYADKNVHKKNFKKLYYASPSKKGDPAQSRNQLIAKVKSTDL